MTTKIARRPIPRCPPMQTPIKHPPIKHPPRCPPPIGPVKPGIAELKHHLHNQNVARDLKGNIQDVLKLVRFGPPLKPAASPRMGPNGQMVAPNGDPLIRVKLSDQSLISGSSQYALVNPRTNEFYVQNNAGGILHPTTYQGPLSLPKGSRFQGEKFTPADLKSFERLANAPGKVQPPNLKALIASGELEYGQPAPDPKNIAKETVISSQHPFTYYAVTLKDDPNHVIIKKVLTGGFVPAKPGDGSYSQPIAIN